MNKKGFTLVELIAVVVVLAIIALIAVPAVNGYLYQADDSYYDSVVSSVLASGRDYYSDFHTLLPKNDNEVREVPISELVEDGYIDEIKTSDDKGTCDGTVYVKRLGNRDYSYCVILKCNDKIVRKTCNDHEEEANTGVSDFEIVNIKEIKDVPQCSSYNELINYTSEKSENKPFIYNNKIIGKIKNKTTNQIMVNNGEEIRVYPDESTLNLNAIGTYKLNYEYSGASSKKTVVTVIDNEPPLSNSIKMTFTYNEKNGTPYECNNDATCNWTINNVVVKFYGEDLAQHNNCNEPGSGITTFYYELEDGEGYKPVPAYRVGDGKYIGYAVINKTYKGTIKAKAVDKSRNEAVAEEIRYLKIDKTKPTCASNDGTTTWTKNDRRVTVTCADNHSGCSAPTFSTNYIATTVTSSITISDKVGNTTDCPVNVYVDKTQPGCTTTSSAGGNWTNKNVTIYGTCSDSHSGCAGDVSKPYSAEQNTTHSPGTVCDSVGNCRECDAIAVKIDKTKPLCDWNEAPETWTSSNRTLTWGCKDTNGSAKSGCKNDQVGSKLINYTAIDFALTPYDIQDNAGNKNSCGGFDLNAYVDKTAPYGKVVVGKICSTCDVYVYFSGAADSHSGLSSAPYSFDGGSSWTSTYNYNAGSFASGYLTAKLRDAVGNTSSVTVYLGRDQTYTLS